VVDHDGETSERRIAKQLRGIANGLTVRALRTDSPWMLPRVAVGDDADDGSPGVKDRAMQSSPHELRGEAGGHAVFARSGLHLGRRDGTSLAPDDCHEG
jgi:hypothetical protein